MKISKHCFIFIIIFLCIPHVGSASYVIEEQLVEPARQRYQEIKYNLGQKYSSLNANIIIQNLTVLCNQANQEARQKGRNRPIQNMLVQSVESLLSKAAQDPRWAILLATTIEKDSSNFSNTIFLADAFAKADVLKFQNFINEYPKQYIKLTKTMLQNASVFGWEDLKKQFSKDKNFNKNIYADSPFYSNQDEKQLQQIANILKHSQFLETHLELK